MSGRYDDIIYMPHHTSPSRKRMAMTDRAAQFSPFAALTGYEAAIEETGRLTDRQIDFDVDGKAMLDEKLRKLADRISAQPEVRITYFVPDSRKSGGAYVDAVCRVRRIDPNRKGILTEEGLWIPFERIFDIAMNAETDGDG